MMKRNYQWSKESYKNEWSTPQAFFDKLNEEFHFTFDACADETNFKCPNYASENGLDISWKGKRVWCNPPYSQTPLWVEKAFYESKNEETLIVLLIPCRMDTKYFHNFILNRAEIRFVRGRLHFNDSKNQAPFPSMVIVFRGPYVDEPKKKGK